MPVKPLIHAKQTQQTCDAILAAWPKFAMGVHSLWFDSAIEASQTDMSAATGPAAPLTSIWIPALDQTSTAVRLVSTLGLQLRLLA